MARYDTYGAADDQIAEDIDSNFKGFNSRSRPDSLEPGMLSNLENSRINLSGIVTKRPPVQIVKSPFTVDANTQFVLPFLLINPVTADVSATGDNTAGSISLNFTSGHGLGLTSEGVIGLTTASPLTNFTQKTNYAYTALTDNLIVVYIPELDGVDIGGAQFTVGGPYLADAQVTEIKASCNYVDPNDSNNEYILLAGNAAAVAVELVSGAPSTEIAYPVGNFISGNATAIQAFDKVYIFEDGQTPMEWDLNLSNDFTFCESGSYTQPTLKSGNCNINDGLVVLNGITNTGFGALVTGDEIVIIDGHNTGLVDGSSYQVAESTSTTVSFYAEVDDVNNDQLDIIGRVSGGAGFIHAPGPKFGVVHQDRLVVPYEYTVDSGENSYTQRGVTDELLISYPFNPEKFDTTYGTFVTAGGQNDYLVSVFSFAEDKLVIFNRKSIAVATNINSFNFENATVANVTKELGLVAPDSVVQVGNQILFLSDNGVYGASFQDLYNLRGNEIPLSSAINPTIENINRNYWDKSSAVYFNNRYYIAVPLGSTTKNNAVLVYNFLNKAWESIDTVDDEDFAYEKLIVAGSGNNRNVFAISTSGGIHQITNTQGANDIIVSQVGSSGSFPQIQQEIKTRQFNLGSIDRKKWNNFELVFGGLQARLGLSVEFENTDNSAVLSTGYVSEDEGGVSIRGRIGNYRAYGAQFTMTSSQGEPTLQQFKVAGALTFNSLENTK